MSWSLFWTVIDGVSFGSIRSDVCARAGSENGARGLASSTADNEVAEATDSSATSRIRQLEGRVESLKSQHGQFRNDVLASMELKAQEIHHLEEANERLMKVRAAASPTARASVQPRSHGVMACLRACVW